MDLFYRTLKWPVISLLITGATHFLLEAIWPDLRNTFIPPVLAPILLAYGAWVGYRAIGAGGTYPKRSRQPRPWASCRSCSISSASD